MKNKKQNNLTNSIILQTIGIIIKIKYTKFNILNRNKSAI
jgi:hypothetical protein